MINFLSSFFVYESSPGNCIAAELNVVIPSYVCGIGMIIPFYWQAKTEAKKRKQDKSLLNRCRRECEPSHVITPNDDESMPLLRRRTGTDRETAGERAETVRSISDIVVYSDASGRQGHLGAAVVALDDNLQIFESQQVQVGPSGRWSVHVAELIGIFHAISTVFKIAHQRPTTVDSGQTTATILCDNRSGLQAIQNVRNKSGQRIVHAILQAATEVQAEGNALRLQ